MPAELEEADAYLLDLHFGLLMADRNGPGITAQDRITRTRNLMPK